MRTYERNGVHVDQCSECRGIFLDRGELERLIDAENAWHAEPGQRSSASASSSTSSSSSAAASTGGLGGGLGAVVSEVLNQARSAKQHSHGSGYDAYGRPYGYSHPRRKKSFLEQLFD